MTNISLSKLPSTSTEPKRIDIYDDSETLIATVYCDGLVRYHALRMITVPEHDKIVVVRDNFFLFYNNMIQTRHEHSATVSDPREQPGDIFKVFGEMFGQQKPL